MNSRLILTVCLITCSFFTKADISANSEPAIQFLLISPSPKANSMGNNFLAISARDGMSIFYNPGNLGIFALENRLSTSFYSNNVNWLTESKWNILYDGKSLNYGFNLPYRIHAGIGFYRIQYDLGTYFDEPAYGVNSPIQSLEKVQALSFGLGRSGKVKIGIGFSIKFVHSKLVGLGWKIFSEGDAAIKIFDPTFSKFSNSEEVSSQSFEADVILKDFGISIKFPFSNMINQQIRYTLGKKYTLRSFMITDLAYSMSNIGKNIRYPRSKSEEPLPRLARAGYAFDMGIIMQSNHLNIKALAFRWSRGAEDLLVKERTPPYYKIRYQLGFMGLGDIDLLENLILGKHNKKITQMRGWEINFFELISIRRGSCNNNRENIAYLTEGYGFNSNGLIKLFLSFSPKNQILNFINKHFELQYNWSKIKNETSYLYNGTEFKGFNLVIR